MSIADIAASAVRAISISSAKKLKRKMKVHEISKHNVHTFKGEKFKVGFSSCEVMPDDLNEKTYWIAGHGPGKPIEGVHDPITVNAMWIGCGDNGGVMMISADIIGLTRIEVAKVRDMFSEYSMKINCKSLNICCTHNHAGFDTVGYWGKLPRTGKNPAYMDKLLNSIVKVSKEAYENRTEGDLYIGTTNVPDAQLDRREPIVLHDVLTRIRFVPDNGSTETWFLNFAAHPNTLGGDNRHVSADYPYYLRETIHAEKNVNILFGIGAIGAVDPGDFCEDRKERTRLQGECLGNAALSIDNDEKVECNISVLRQPFYYPVDNGVLAFLAMLKVMSSKRYPCDKGDLGLALKSEMTYMKLGNQKILLLPGESFPETVYGGYDSAEKSATGKGPEINPTPLVEIANDEKLLVFGVTNDMTGYVVSPNDFTLHKTQPYLSNGRDRFDRSHYHETNSLGYNASQTLADNFKAMVEIMGE
ncbi:MAG: hypothetical protein IKW03_00625 [Clostridia bacterium]|nr:hypothetical protein [Clostridia bacterium]